MNKAICQKCMRKRFEAVHMDAADGDDYVNQWWSFGNIYCLLESGRIAKTPTSIVAPVGCPYFLEQLLHQEINS